MTINSTLLGDTYGMPKPKPLQTSHKPNSAMKSGNKGAALRTKTLAELSKSVVAANMGAVPKPKSNMYKLP